MKKQRVFGTFRHCVLMAMLLFCVLFSGQRAQAADYDIQQYHVDMSVSENNVYTITETIKVFFSQSRHGIYRDIPLKNNVTRADGSTAKVKAVIRNISCGGETYSVSAGGGSCRIKIGDSDKTVIGEKTYTIFYQYDMGNDVLKGADELYYNIIGSGWNATIRNVSFSIQMPRPFDESLLGMVYGRPGSSNTGGLTYSLEGNRIDGVLDSGIILYPGEAVTVRLELPEGYFVRKSNIPWLPIVAFVLGIITVVVSYVLWNTYGRDDPVVETVEFYAPDGLNSAEAAYVHDGILTDKGVVSLVVYLAQKGYIEIREGAGGRKKGFTLIHKKTYDGRNVAESMFMAGLFKNGNVVTKKDLENKFYKTVGEVNSHITLRFKYKIFYTSSLNKNIYLYLLQALVFLAAGYIPVYRLSLSILKAVAYPLISSALILVVFSFLWNVTSSLVARIVSFVTSGYLMGVTAIALMGEAIFYADRLYQAAFVYAILICAVAAFFAAYMSKRTPYGNEMLGKLAGFKRFLETAEKSRLEAMVAQDPQYFYDILPYTYALGVSDKWMEKFESIAMEPPTWHHSHNGGSFNIVAFHRFMNSTMSSVNKAMTSSPNSSHGGGGVSGGGSGGGGGGSW